LGASGDRRGGRKDTQLVSDVGSGPKEIFVPKGIFLRKIQELKHRKQFFAAIMSRRLTWEQHQLGHACRQEAARK
jgi:hypothetical protein